jgi:hypothetical protein
MHSDFRAYRSLSRAIPYPLIEVRGQAQESKHRFIRVSGAAGLCALCLATAYVTDDPLTNGVFGFLFFLLLVSAPKIGTLTYYLLATISAISGITNNQPSIPLGQYGTITYSGILAVVFIIGSLMGMITRLRYLQFKKTLAEFKGLKSYLLFSAIVLVITMLAHGNADGIKGAVGYITPTVLFLCLGLYFKPDEYKYLRDMLLVSLLVAIFRVPFFLASGSSYSMTKGGYSFVRYRPDALSEVDYSLFIVTLLPIAFFGLFGAQSRTVRVFWFLLAATAVVSIVPFWARAAFVALGFIIIVQFFLRQQYRRAWLYLVLSLMVVVVSPAWFLANDIFSTGVADPLANTFADRLRNLWLPAMPKNAMDFLLGIGPREIGNYMFRIVGEYLPAIHSIYLTILLEAGFISLVIFIAANLKTILGWISEIRNSERNSTIQKQITCLVLPIFVFLIGAATSTAAYNLFYFQIFMFLGLGQLLLRENKDLRSPAGGSH